MDAQLKAQLAQTIYIAHFASADGHGDPTFGTPYSQVARVELMPAKGGAVGGQSDAQVHRVITEGVVLMSDCVWLPDDARTADLAHRPKSVSKLVDELGAVYGYEVRL